MELSDLSTEELQAELNKRTANGTMPMQWDDPHLKRLREACGSVMEDFAIKGHSKGHASKVYEAAMKAIYGPNVFDWINEYDVGE